MDVTGINPAQVVVEARWWSRPEVVERAFAEFRNNAPVAWIDEPGYRPFWLLTKHADVAAIERDADRFTTLPRPSLQPIEMEKLGLGRTLSTLSHKDGEDHRLHRAVTANWFRPKNLATLEEGIRRLAREAVDELADLDGSMDFATELAWRYPLRVILSILGLPDDDIPLLIKLTHELFAYSDLELARDQNPAASLQAAREFQDYFHAVSVERRRNPTEDLASVIANAMISGEPMSDFSQASYFISIAAGGIYTVSLALAGGLLALLRHPEQLELLQRGPEWIPNATEEIARWTTPIRHMMRTAQQDCELRGVQIAKGDALLLSYVSANRDEAVFEHPGRFDVTRSDSRQIAYGFGVHYCLGAPLARMMMRVLLQELLGRLQSVELIGEPSWTESTLVGGVKHLPIRCILK